MALINAWRRQPLADVFEGTAYETWAREEHSPIQGCAHQLTLGAVAERTAEDVAQKTGADKRTLDALAVALRDRGAGHTKFCQSIVQQPSVL